jgi:hypothetical protein
MTADLEGGDDVEEEKRFEEHVCSLFWIRAGPREKRKWTPFYASLLLCSAQFNLALAELCSEIAPRLSSLDYVLILGN